MNSVSLWLNVLSMRPKNFQTRSTYHDWDSDTEEVDSPTMSLDHMDLYLQGDVVDQSVIDDAGGVLCYWERELKTRPQLAQMALDFLSAPGEAIFIAPSHSGSQPKLQPPPSMQNVPFPVAGSK